MKEKCILATETKNFSIDFLQEQNDNKFYNDITVNNLSRLSQIKLNDLTSQDLIYLLKKHIGLNFLIVVIVEKLIENGFCAFTFNLHEDKEKDEQKEIIKELFLVNDNYWYENPIAYDKFKNFIYKETHWIINILVPEYVVNHFLNLELKTISWTNETTLRLSDWIALDNASGYSQVISQIKHIRRALDNGVKVIYNTTPVLDFETFINLVVKKLNNSNYILTEVSKEVRLKNIYC